VAYHTPYSDPALYDVVYSKIRDDIPFYVDLARRADGPVLEVGCGTGRVLLPTLEAGVAIEGLDLDPGMLDRLRLKAQERGFDARVYQGDMRDFTMPGRYRLVTIPFRAFMHLDHTEDQIRSLLCIREHLEPGGALAMNLFYPNFDFMKARDGVRELSMEVKHPETGRSVAVYDLSRFDRVNQRVAVEREVVEHDEAGRPARSTAVGFQLRWTYRFELELLLGAAGFARVDLYGGFDRRLLERDHDEMVVVAWRD
jgi:SAM-dependent methyltransferase